MDLPDALEQLGTAYGIDKALRVESGGVLNGLLMRSGLVDEVAVLVHPLALGGQGRPTMFCGPPSMETSDPVRLRLIGSDLLENGLVHLRYAVERH